MTEVVVPSAASHRKGVGIGRAVDECVVGAVGRVGPGAGRIDGEGAVSADGGGLRHEAGRAVDVADRQRAGGGQRSIGLGQGLWVSDDSTAASLVPRMVTVTEVVVPSAARTAKVSV